MYLLVAVVCVSSVLASPLQVAKPTPFKTLNSRIINGEAAEEGQFPWNVQVVALFGDHLTMCGGALIASDWVLTAAHCANTAYFFTIFTGGVEINDGTQALGNISYIHEDFSPESVENDIAVINLWEDVILSDLVQVIPLASSRADAGTTLVVSGWGIASDDDEQFSIHLRFVYLQSISLDDCEAVYGQLHEGTLCTGSDRNLPTGLCTGDSGAPLVTFDSTPVHVGIASFAADNACEAGWPSGFTETAYFRAWITQKTGI